MDYDCYLELELSWDPVANINASELRDGVEALFNADDTTNDGDFSETFMKYKFEDKGLLVISFDVMCNVNCFLVNIRNQGRHISDLL